MAELQNLQKIPAQFELEKIVQDYGFHRADVRVKHEWSKPKVEWETFVDDDRFRYCLSLPTRCSILVKQICKQCGAIKYIRAYYTSYPSNPSWHWELNRGNARIVYPADYENSLCMSKNRTLEKHKKPLQLRVRISERKEKNFRFLIPAEKIPPKLGKSVLYDTILEEFIRSGLKYAEVGEVGRRPATVQIMLKKILKERHLENIKVILRNKRVYLERPDISRDIAYGWDIKDYFDRNIPKGNKTTLGGHGPPLKKDIMHIGNSIVIKIRCPMCRALNAKDARYCRDCGHRFYKSYEEYKESLHAIEELETTESMRAHARSLPC